MYAIKVYYDTNSTMRQYSGEDVHQTAKVIGKWLQQIGKDFEAGHDLQETIDRYGKCQLPDGRLAGEITEINTLERFVKETRRMDEKRSAAERRAEIYSALRTVNSTEEFTFGKGITFGQIKNKFEENIGSNRSELGLDNVKPHEKLFGETLYDTVNQGIFTERMNYKAIEILNKQIGYSHSRYGTIDERAAINEALQNYRSVSHALANNPNRDGFLEYMRQTVPRSLQVNENYRKAFGSLDSIKAVIKKFDEKQIASEEDAYRAMASVFVNSVKHGTLPAFNERDAHVTETGEYVFHPDTVCLESNGKRIEGVNGLLLEMETRRKGFSKNKEDGCIHVIEGGSTGKNSNQNPDERIVIGTADGGGERTYQLYPAVHGGGKKVIGLRQFEEQVITAKSVDMTPAEYLGRWSAASQLGCAFVTDKDTLDVIKERLGKEMESMLGTGNVGSVYNFGMELEKAADKVIGKITADIISDKKVCRLNDISKNSGGIER